VWPEDGITADRLTPGVVTSIEKYMDKPLAGNYGSTIFLARSNDRVFYGLSPDKLSQGARDKLKKNGAIYDGDGNQYSGTGLAYMIIR
jgi:hypothetical protein